MQRCPPSVRPSRPAKHVNPLSACNTKPILRAAYHICQETPLQENLQEQSEPKLVNKTEVQQADKKPGHQNAVHLQKGPLIIPNRAARILASHNHHDQRQETTD